MLPHADQEGLRNLTCKEDIVKYLQDAFYADMFAAIGSEPRLRILRVLLAAHLDGMVLREIQTVASSPNSSQHRPPGGVAGDVTKTAGRLSTNPR